MKQTLTEKIFSRHSGRAISAGELVIAELDWVMAHDTTCAWALAPFYQIAQKVWNPERVLIFFDHAYPAPSVDAAQLQSSVREFARDQEIPLRTEGVSHQVMVEKYIRPGQLVLGADSHTPTSGALGALTIGAGSTDAAIAMASGRLWFRVPRTLRVELSGEMPRSVAAKDVALAVAGKLGPDGAHYRTAEYSGPAIKRMSVPERMTLTNMAAELGAKAAIVEPDERTISYLQEHGRSVTIEGLYGDRGAASEEVVDFSVSEVVPMVALPPEIDRVIPASLIEESRVAVDQIFLGSCTNGRIEDLEVAYSLWRGRELNPGVRVIIAPASREVYLEALRLGYIEEFSRLGAIVIPPGCGPCLGRHSGVLAPGEVCLSSANRNFPGRMGSAEASVYLASPATLAASALEGFICDPRRFLV